MSVGRDDKDQKVAIQGTQTDPQAPNPILASIFTPIRFAFLKGFSFLRPIAPQLIPLTIFLLLIPLILLLSVFAGWIVWKNVAVGWETTLDLQYGDGIPPYAEGFLPNIVPQQRYDISLHLVVPAIEANFALGNFMTTLRLSTPSNQTLTYIRRPSIAIPPKTGSIPLLSSKPSLVDMNVPLLTSYAAGTTQVVAYLTLGRKDGWRSLGSGEGREISVLSASLRGEIRHHGVRGLVTRFPLVSAFISAITFLIISSLIIAACLLPTMRWQDNIASLLDTVPSEPDERLPPPGRREDDDGASSDDEKLRKRRRRSRRRKSRSASQKPDIKAEATTTIIPPADSRSTPTR